ncbi:MAG: hypothetical protein HC896_16905 [Bacteroidales bacterium]|nr:hypothetical protein [Bacteroidales bacterium]
MDKAIETGQSLEVKRKGVIVKIVPPPQKNKLDNIVKREGLNCKPEDLLNIDWSKEWKEPFV